MVVIPEMVLEVKVELARLKQSGHVIKFAFESYLNDCQRQDH
jgi:hypothetical protein